MASLLIVGAKGVLLAGALLLAGSLQIAAPQHVQAGPPTGYDLVPSFAEEFDGPQIDPSRWIHMFADPGTEGTIAKRNLWANGERQIYFDPAYLGLGIDPFRLADGILTIRAEPLQSEARARLMGDLARQPPEIRSTNLWEVTHSSGMISTRGLFHQRYGYFEMRARWSGDRGLWPAFWLLPEGGGWPPEIDIVEAHGDRPGVAYHSIHSRIAPRDVTRTAHYRGQPGTFHRFGALWRPDRIDYFIDGRLVATNDVRPDMHVPMYILVTLGVGGHWPGYPEPGQTRPMTLDIDYVRAWRFNRLPDGANPGTR